MSQQRPAPLSKLITHIAQDPYRISKTTSIADLVRILEKLSKCYYDGKPLVTDDIYDIIRGVLEERDPSNPALDAVGAPISGENKVKLPYSMRSLDKIKPEKRTLRAKVNGYSGRFIVSDKLDGISALLYQGSSGTKLYTRGDGTRGQDITHLLSSLIKKSTLRNVPLGAAIRGELIIPETSFDRFKKEYKNARNLVAGLANSKTMDSRRKEILRYVHFVPYIIYDPVIKPLKQMHLLRTWGFEPVWHKIIMDVDMNEEVLSKLLQQRRHTSPYRIDGLVVTHNTIEAPTTSGNPEHSFAFKSMVTNEMVEAIVTHVAWRVSKDAYLKPTVHIEPIELNDVTVSRATAFNAKWISDNRIGPGSRISIVRSGDVIPYIVDVLSRSKRPQMPTGDWEWGDTGVDAIGIGTSWDRDVTIAKNIFFFEVMDVRGLGEGVISKLYDAGLTTIKDVITATTTNLAKIDRMGVVSARKLRAALDESLSTLTIDKLMVASQTLGRSFGLRKVRVVLQTYPDILRWHKTLDATIHKLMDVNGFAEKSATRFANGLREFKIFYANMKKYFPKATTTAKRSSTDGQFMGMKVVLTGFRDKAIQAFIEREGGSITGSVSKNTHLVVYVGEDQSKVQRAKELHVKMLSRSEFEKTYNIHDA